MTKGRQAFTPDVAGVYILQLALSDGTVTDFDTVVVSAGDAVQTNVAPVAEISFSDGDGLPSSAPAGFAAGQPILVSGVSSSDVDGDRLAYAWSIVSAPVGSAAQILNTDQPIATFTPDVVGDYIVSLSVDDAQLANTTTVLISPNAVPPVANAGVDVVLPTSRLASLDGSASTFSDPASSQYLWSVLGLGSPGAFDAAALSAATSVTSTISFSALPGAGANPAAILEDYDLIVVKNANSRSQVWGRAFIGGNLNGQSSDYSTGLSGLSQGDVTLTVGDNINGQPKNINNGGSVIAGGRANANINLNGGGSLQEFQTVDVASVEQSINALSGYLASLADTGTLSIPTGQPSGVTINAVPGADGVAVLSLSDGDDLFNNNKVQSIDIKLNGATALVVNVGSNKVKLKKANFVGSANSEAVRSKVIWNFPQAVNIQTSRHLSGSLLAPNAMLKNDSPIYGAVAVRQINHRAAITTPGFQAFGAFGGTPTLIDAAVVQLKTSDQFGVDFDTVLVTNGNIAPVGTLSTVGTRFDVGSSVVFSAAGSSDANGDPLTYRWALLSKPVGSSALTPAAGTSATTSLVLDKRGAYVVQMIASDGTLDSAPVTAVVFGNNQVPIITSQAPEAGATENIYSYQATGQDNDGDVLTWALTAGPVGMALDTATGAITWTPTDAGTFDLVLTADDGNGGIAQQSFSIAVVFGANRMPPVLSSVPDVTIRPGQTSEFTLVASDPEGETLSYWSTNLPSGAVLNSETGAFSYTATLDAIGTRQISVSVSDGIFTDTKSFTLTVEPWPVGDPTLFSGQVLDAIDFALGTETPVVGATVSLGGQTAVTAADGSFSFATVAAFGQQALGVDGQLATPVAGGDTFGTLALTTSVYENSPNIQNAPILLSRFSGSAPVLTVVQTDLPPGLRACRVQRVDSIDGTSVDLAQTNLNTSEPLLAGAEISIWRLDGTAANGYTRVGSADVDSNGTDLTSVVGTVPSGSLLAVSPIELSGSISPLQPQDSYVPSLLGEGNMQTGVALPAYSSLSATRASSLIYNSVAASPRPIITANITVPIAAVLTGTLETELLVNGQKVPGTLVTDLTKNLDGTNPNLSDDADVSVSVSVSFDASAFATGAYPYQLYVFAGHTCSSAAAKVDGTVFVNNRSNSPYGSGWKPTELQTLVINPDGLVVEEPNGGLSKYDLGEIAPPYVEGFDAGLGNWEVNRDGENLTFVASGGNPGGHIRAFDKVGGFTWYYVAPPAVTENLRGYLDGRLTYDIRQNATSSQYTTWDILIFGRDAEGNVIRAGRRFNNNPLTSWTSYSAALDGVNWLVPQTIPGDPFRFSVGPPVTRSYFEQVLSTAEVFWIRGEYRSGADNSRLDNVQFIGKDATGEALAFETPDGHFDRLVQLQDGTYERRYKDGTVVKFNGIGLQTSVTDTNGNTTAYAYDAQNRVTAITDPVGLITQYRYANGKLDTIVDPSGRLTAFFYDAQGRMTRAIYPDTTETKFASDEAGLITSQTDRRGQTTGYDYDPVAGRLTGSTAPDGGTVKLDIARSLGFGNVANGDPNSYVAPAQRVTAMVDAKGNEAEQEVNEWGAVVRNTDPLGRITRYDRDEDNLITRITAPSSSTPNGILVSEIDYDERGNAVVKREAVGTAAERSQSYEYEPTFNRLTRAVDAAGFAMIYAYDASANLLKTTHPDGTFVSHTYNAQGQKLTTTDERGNVMSYTYDAQGRVEGMVDPQLVERKLVLDPAGNTLASFDAFGTPIEQRVNRTFDTHNRNLTVQNAENETSTFTYDEAGNRLTVADPTGVGSAVSYDDKQRLAAVVDPSAGTSTTDYDLNDNLTKATASDGSETTMEYDPVNRITQAVDALGHVQRVAYDSRDNIIAITDGRGNTTTFAYDALDREITRTNPNGNVWTSEYDNRNLRTAFIKPDGTRLEFTYDNRKRLISMAAVGQAESLRTFTYDEENNLTAAIAAAGTSQELAHAFTYDNRDQLTGAALTNAPLAGTFNFTYEYDALGRRIAMRDSAGAVTGYLYDKADRLTGIVLPSGKAVSMAYDDGGRRSDVLFPNGLNTRAGFQTPVANAGTTGRLASISYGLDGAGQGGSALNQKLGTFSYAYDVKGNITGIAESANITAAGPRTRTHTLDAINRLTSVVNGAGQETESYTLDEEGNRLTSHLSNFHLTDPSNRLLEDETYTFEYDVNGNMVRKTVKATGLTWRYTYSVWDELIRATRHADATVGANAETRIEYTFDAMGRRITERRFDNTGTPTGGYNWRYDGQNIAHEETVDATGTASPKQWNTHSNNADELISLTLPTGTAIGATTSPTATATGPDAPSASSAYAHTNHQSSVRAITDDAGQVLNEYSYDSYGNIETEVEALPQRYRYTGREWDAATGLYHYRARAYDAELGRFLQEDPIWFNAGDLNVYRYTWGNPHNWSDPSGLTATTEYGGGASQAVARVGVLASIGNRMSCMFSMVSGVLGAITEAQERGFQPSNLTTYANYVGGVAMDCGAGMIAKRVRISKCEMKRTLRLVMKLGHMAANISLLTGNSFTGDTLVLTSEGHKLIRDIRVGDIVAAVDEITGEQVWRKVVHTFSRMADTIVEITIVDGEGNTETIKATPEHPFHVQNWDGKPKGNLLAALEGEVSAETIIPTAHKANQFGDWVKAGALKKDDVFSSYSSDNNGFANANVLRFGLFPKRVHNFEVESAETGFTNNYLVGASSIWVHNARIRGPQRRAQRERQPNCQHCGIPTVFSGPRTGPRTNRFSCDHIDPQVRGGGDGKENIQTLCVPCNSRKGAR